MARTGSVCVPARDRLHRRHEHRLLPARAGAEGQQPQGWFGHFVFLSCRSRGCAPRWLLRYPDLAAKLTEPPTVYPSPEKWNGYSARCPRRTASAGLWIGPPSRPSPCRRRLPLCRGLPRLLLASFGFGDEGEELRSSLTPTGNLLPYTSTSTGPTPRELGTTEIADELRKTVGQARRLIDGERPPRRVSVACTCGHTLRVTLDIVGIRCPMCGTQYGHSELFPTSR